MLCWVWVFLSRTYMLVIVGKSLTNFVNPFSYSIRVPILKVWCLEWLKEYTEKWSQNPAAWVQEPIWLFGDCKTFSVLYLQFSVPIVVIICKVMKSWTGQVVRTEEMAQWLKYMSQKPDYLNLIHGTYVKIEGKNQFHKVFHWPLNIYWDKCEPTAAYAIHTHL